VHPSGIGGASICNLDEMFTGQICDRCGMPSGVRSDAPLHISFKSGYSRRYDGLLAQMADFPRGPTLKLFSDRFIEALATEERAGLRWREVIGLKPTKTTRCFFELLGASHTGAVVAPDGGTDGAEVCVACGRAALRSDSWRTWSAQWYVARQTLPNPLPPSFAFGEQTRGLMLAIPTDTLPPWRAPAATLAGVRWESVGIVARQKQQG
jgi:hypothetical protein